MKNWIYIIFIAFLVPGCAKDITEKNPYLIVNSEQEINDFLTGIYGQLTRVHNADYFYNLVRSDDVNVYTYYVANNGRFGSPTNGPDYVRIKDEMYRRLYSAIVNANYALENLIIPNSDKYVGELHFLRAYCYFKLVRIYGQVPLVTNCEVDYTLPKPSFEEIYNFIEAEFKKALELLPANYQDCRVLYETPHQGTVKAYLAELYLNRAGYPLNDKSKYAEAARLAGEVIENASFYNYALEPDFADLWKEEKRHTSENVFGLHYSSDNNVGGNDVYTSQYGYNNDVYYINNDVDQGVRGEFKPEFSFFEDFPLNYRKYNSLILGYYTQERYYTFDSLITDRYMENYGANHENNVPRFIMVDPLTDPLYYTRSSVFYIKWLKLEPVSTNKYGSLIYEARRFSLLYLLRYAQTLLTYAEAKARSGDLDQSAYDLVNMIRRRANHLDLNTPSEFDLQPGLTPEQFADSVVWERAWELCFEPDSRWFDIIRLDLKDELFLRRWPTDKFQNIKTENLSDDWYFYKIPQDDRWINPNFD